MTIGILGKKLGMTQLFQEDGTVVPVTVIQAGPCKVLQVKTREATELPEEHRTAAANKGKKSGSRSRPRRDDGYYSIQIGFDAKDARHASKAEQGHSAKSGAAPMRFVRELRYDAMPPYQQGDEIKVGIFAEVGHVDVTGTSKGLGHSGTIRRYGFARQASSHGNSKSHRRLGGIGRQYSTAKGVTKGKKMPGRKGMDRITVQNLKVIKVDEDRNLLYVRGAIPGKPDGYLLIRKAVKKKK